MLKLKTLLQYNYIYTILIAISIVVVVINNNTSHNSIYNLNDKYFCGKITDVTNSNFILKTPEKLLIKTKENIKFGDYLCISGELTQPKNNTIPNTFNYKKYLNNKKIYFTVYDYKIIKHKRTGNIYYKFKNYIYEKIVNSELKDYYVMLFLGDKSYLDKELKDVYIKNGISHVFSFSGFHLNLLNVTVLFILSKLNLNKTLEFYLNVFLILLYFSLIIASFSAIRSLVLFILLKINKRYDFYLSTLKVFIISTSFIIIFNPNSVFDLSFQYSYLATLGLMLNNNKNENYLYGLFSSSITALIFTVPVSLYYNFEINLLSVLNNMLIVPIISFIVYPLLLLTMLFKFLTPFTLLITNSLEVINVYLSKIDFFIINIPKVNIIFYIVYYIFIYLYINTLNKNYLMYLIIYLLLFKAKPYLDKNNYVYFIDVGQGDSSLIINNNNLIMIDTGGLYNYTVSDNTIKFIKSLGYTKIDALILTHGHMDHMKDAPNIINNLKVKNVMINANDVNELERVVIDLKPNLVNSYNKNNVVTFNKYVNEDENESSIITYYESYNTKFLFLGDIYKNIEERLISEYNIKADVVKLAHHGSKTSSSELFLSKLKPKEAIISSGLNNRFKHPSKETIHTLNKLNINYTETSKCGTIQYKLSNNNVTKRCFAP